MLTLLGSLLGFITSAFPQLLGLIKDWQDRRHELAILDRQMEMQRQGHTQRLEEIAVSAADVRLSSATLQTVPSRPSSARNPPSAGQHSGGNPLGRIGQRSPLHLGARRQHQRRGARASLNPHAVAALEPVRLAFEVETDHEYFLARTMADSLSDRLAGTIPWCSGGAKFRGSRGEASAGYVRDGLPLRSVRHV